MKTFSFYHFSPGAEEEASCSAGQSERPSASGRGGPEKALDALLLAAPNKGEVQPWVWLLGAVAQRCCITSMHAGVSYLVSPDSFATIFFLFTFFLYSCVSSWDSSQVQKPGCGLAPVQSYSCSHRIPDPRGNFPGAGAGGQVCGVRGGVAAVAGTGADTCHGPPARPGAAAQ